MDPVKRIRSRLSENAQLVLDATDALAAPIARAANVMTECLFSDGKILACGNGGSAADAQRFAAALVGGLERERPELPAIALGADAPLLTAITNTHAFDQVYARQVRALGARGDVLLAISTSGRAANIVAAIGAARERDMRVVALTGNGGGQVGELLAEGDVHVCVPDERVSRIQEVHVLAIHCLCEMIDHTLLGDDE